MITELIRTYLKDKTKYTNFLMPNNGDGEETELINTRITLKYRDHSIMNLQALDYPATITDESGSPMRSRPDDDPYDVIPINPEGPDFDEEYVYVDEFIIVKSTNNKCKEIVAINDDMSVVLVSTYENGAYIDRVHIYDLQRFDLIGTCYKVTIDGEERNAYVIAASEGEPCHGVLAVPYDDSVKFITTDDFNVYETPDEYDPPVIKSIEDIITYRQELLEEYFEEE